MSPGSAAASLLADLGHEVPTALLPTFLRDARRARRAALGLIEGIADGCAGVARFAGGALADDPERRRRTARRRLHRHRCLLVADRRHDRRLAGRRVCVRRPGRRAACACPPGTRCSPTSCRAEAYGRAYGFERAMDNLGAIGGPLLAIALVALVGVRTAMLVSVIPGLLATSAILYAIRATRRRDRADAAAAPHPRPPRPAGAARPAAASASARSSSATSPRRC